MHASNQIFYGTSIFADRLIPLMKIFFPENKISAKILFALLFTSLTFLSDCTRDGDSQYTDPCGGSSPGGLVNLLVSTDDDIKMGLSTVTEIEGNSNTYHILDSAQYSTAYGHIYRIRNTILAGGKVHYEHDFPWRIRILKDDSTLNAFCTPGGFIYVYTGIIKFLDNETQLAGVIGHEMAHADRRHGANQMIKQYGVTALLSILTGGNPGTLTQLAVNLLLLKYSRADETEADDYSVRFLYPTEYDPRGAKYFFEKIGTQPVPEFLSTHPNPENRVKDIEAKWKCLGGRIDDQTFETRYAQFKNSLPH